MNEMPAASVRLREPVAEDVPVLFEHQRDPEARWMAAFTRPETREIEAFSTHWARNVADEANDTWVITLNDRVAGYIAAFNRGSDREVCYWVGPEFWGRGVASAALTQLLKIALVRPLIARAAADNLGSIRVLEKCGFVRTGEETSYAAERGTEILEVVMVLE